MSRPVRWAVVGTANIAAKSFLPALAAAGGGVAALAASRDPSRATAWAAEHGVERGVASYAEAVTADDVDAVYIALPNALHAEWTIAALEGGKAVLCEKPLCVDAAECARVLDVARRTGSSLWEAFVFAHGAQFQWLTSRISAGDLGDVREVHSSFHFQLSAGRNIRLDPALAGGSLYDVGCYPVRFAQLVFDAEPTAAVATAVVGEPGVDLEAAGVLSFGERRLLVSCGFRLPSDVFTRVIGTEGELRIAGPFHPVAGSAVELWRAGERVETWRAPDVRSFSFAIAHIQAVVRGETAPEHLAVDDSLATAHGLDLLRAAALP